MPYYNGIFNGANAFQSSVPGTPVYPQPQSQMYTYQPQQSAGTNGTIEVNSKESAHQYCQRMGPNSTSPAMFDTTHVGIMYIGTTDGAGVPTVEAFDYFPHVDKPAQPALDSSQYVSRTELENIVKQLREEISNGIHGPIQPATTPTDGLAATS